MVVELEVGKGLPEWACHLIYTFRFSSGISSSRKPSAILPGNLPEQMAMPFPILLDLSVSQGSRRAGTTDPSIERHPALHGVWGLSSSHSSASPGLCAHL